MKRVQLFYTTLRPLFAGGAVISGVANDMCNLKSKFLSDTLEASIAWKQPMVPIHLKDFNMHQEHYA